MLDRLWPIPYHGLLGFLLFGFALLFTCPSMSSNHPPGSLWIHMYLLIGQWSILSWLLIIDWTICHDRFQIIIIAIYDQIKYPWWYTVLLSLLWHSHRWNYDESPLLASPSSIRFRKSSQSSRRPGSFRPLPIIVNKPWLINRHELQSMVNSSSLITHESIHLSPLSF